MYILIYNHLIIEYDALNYLPQNTKKHLSYDKLRILAEENRRD